jgi:arsenite methyltransferase
VSGALAERDFVDKLKRVGFIGVTVVERAPYGIDDAVMYPLFTDELVELMRTLIAREKQDRIGMSVVLKARWGTRTQENAIDTRQVE